MVRVVEGVVVDVVADDMDVTELTISGGIGHDWKGYRDRGHCHSSSALMEPRSLLWNPAIAPTRGASTPSRPWEPRSRFYLVDHIDHVGEGHLLG